MYVITRYKVPHSNCERFNFVPKVLCSKTMSVAQNFSTSMSTLSWNKISLWYCGQSLEKRPVQHFQLHEGQFILTLLRDLERRWLPRLLLKKLPRLSDAVSSFFVALNCAVANSSARDLFGMMPF